MCVCRAGKGADAATPMSVARRLSATSGGFDLEADATAAFLRRAGCRRVALQFPDELLVHAPRAAAALKGRLGDGCEAIVLADTTFGPCCVDEVAAAHAGCDAVVHYGRACLSPTLRLPARFVLGRTPLDEAAAAARLAEAAATAAPTPLVVLCSLEYAHALAGIGALARECLAEGDAGGAEIVFGELEPLERVPAPPVAGSGGARLLKVSEARGRECGCGPSGCGASADARTAPAPKSPSPVADANSHAADAASTESGARDGRISLGGLSFRLPRTSTADGSASDSDEDGAGDTPPAVSLAWIGGEGPALTSALMTLAPTIYCRYDPALEPVRSVGDDGSGGAGGDSDGDGDGACGGAWLSDEPGAFRALQRRYFLVEKAKDASIVGVLAGTLGVAGYEEAIERVVRLAEAAGKRAYVFAMGKPNPAKLANFPECGVFVLVACAQTALLDSKDFYAPVITVYEAELAFEDRMWGGRLRLDGGAMQVAAAAEAAAEAAEGTAGSVDMRRKRGEEEEGRFSMVRGAYMAAAGNSDFGAGCSADSESDGDASDGGDGAAGAASGARALANAALGRELAVRAERALQMRSDASGTLEAASAAEYLVLKRTYQGLEAELEDGKAEDTRVHEGWAGRAAGYAHDTGQAREAGTAAGAQANAESAKNGGVDW